MNITSNIDVTNLTSLIIGNINEYELISSTITTKIITSKSTSIFFHLTNSTKKISLLRLSSTTTLSLLNKYFIFKSSFNRIIRIIELFILSLTLPLYAIVFILFIQLTVLRINKNTAISGGNSRIRSQRRRQRLHSLIWTSNYLLVDFLGLLYELAYVIIHLSGELSLISYTGRFYCQVQVYLPLYLTVLMSYNLTAISIYRRQHFVNLNTHISRPYKKFIIMISALWIIPIITLVIPTYLLTYFNILKITQDETTNQCQIFYTYESNFEALYIFYRLGNIFLLPISISLACYVTIYVDVIRMQRRFSRAFKRHVHTRKNLISQILFLFLNFAVFWLPAELMMLYATNRYLKDAIQVTKSLNIFLDPLIITGFDTRFSSAARQLLTRCPFSEFLRFHSTNRQHNSSISSQAMIKKRLKRSGQTTSQKLITTTTYNIANTDDTIVLDSIPNHFSQKQKIKQQQQTSSVNRRQSINNRQISIHNEMKLDEKHT